MRQQSDMPPWSAATYKQSYCAVHVSLMLNPISSAKKESFARAIIAFEAVGISIEMIEIT